MKAFHILSAYLITRRVLRQLAKFQGKVVLTWNHIGDICLALAFLPSFGEKPVLVVGEEKHSELLASYMNSNRSYKCLSQKEIYSMLTCARNDYLKRVFRKYSNIVVTDPWYYFDWVLDKKKDFSIIDFYRDCVFFYTGALEFPSRTDETPEEVIDAIHGNEYIVLSPFAGSSDDVDNAFWNNLVDVLHQFAPSIVCNIGPGQTPIPGTIPFSGNIYELRALAKNSKAMIGLRSGAFDITRGLSVPTFAIYKGKYQNIYSLKNWGENAPLEEADYSEQWEVLISKISDFIKTL